MNQQPRPDILTPSPRTVDLSQRIYELCEETHRRTGIPGISVALSVHGERSEVSIGTTSASSGDPMTGETRFATGCITKMLTSLIALELVSSGKISLHDSIADYLPKLCRGSDKGKIRVGHLGSHTSGYQGLNPGVVEHGYFYSWEKFCTFFPGGKQIFEPGTIFNYEHTEGVILGEIVRRVTRFSPMELAQELLFDPLKTNVGASKKDETTPHFRAIDHVFDIDNRCFKPVRAAPYCKFWASSLADMTLSVRDLAAIGEVLTGYRKVPGISPQTLDAIRSPMISLPAMHGGPDQETMPRAFGFGCAEYAPGLLGHNGSSRGQTCAFRFDPGNGVVAVVAMNAWEPSERDRLVARILDLVRPKSTHAAHRQEEWPILTCAELEGTYEGTNSDIRITAVCKDSDLLLSMRSESARSDLRIHVRFDQVGQPQLKSDARYLSIGLLREMSTGNPCLMLGLNAFKRIDSAMR